MPSPHSSFLFERWIRLGREKSWPLEKLCLLVLIKTDRGMAHRVLWLLPSHPIFYQVFRTPNSFALPSC